jgi:hypothetical protein
MPGLKGDFYTTLFTDASPLFSRLPIADMTYVLPHFSKTYAEQQLHPCYDAFFVGEGTSSTTTSEIPTLGDGRRRGWACA